MPLTLPSQGVVWRSPGFLPQSCPVSGWPWQYPTATSACCHHLVWNVLDEECRVVAIPGGVRGPSSLEVCKTPLSSGQASSPPLTMHCAQACSHIRPSSSRGSCSRPCDPALTWQGVVGSRTSMPCPMSEPAERVISSNWLCASASQNSRHMTRGSVVNRARTHVSWVLWCMPGARADLIWA